MQNIAVSCLNNNSFFLILRLPMKNYPIFAKMGAGMVYAMVVSEGRTTIIIWFIVSDFYECAGIPAPEKSFGSYRMHAKICNSTRNLRNDSFNLKASF